MSLNYFEVLKTLTGKYGNALGLSENEVIASVMVFSSRKQLDKFVTEEKVGLHELIDLRKAQQRGQVVSSVNLGKVPFTPEQVTNLAARRTLSLVTLNRVTVFDDTQDIRSEAKHGLKSIRTHFFTRQQKKVTGIHDTVVTANIISLKPNSDILRRVKDKK